ncbi:MAG TPA: NADH-quinone oxidoreductase subunit NuoG [Acidimicrobiales bacterium]|nr:NADH-quinone oxidoreductase subunit NuoG [Acidimicrobiales bacterium]
MKITVDGREVECDKGELVIAVAERAGVYIPRFCYHPRMRSVGMCRMCLVNVDGGRGPAITASCIAEVADGMVVDTQAPTVKHAQDAVLEFLLINHPLDCPVCDKGGECPLQDQTLRYGPGESRFVEEKRHFAKPIAISPLVLLDRERCILCDRCTRFSKEVAGDPLIHFFDRGNQTEVNTFPDHPFASYFSGNVVQLCPVGALTSASYRFTARPWDIDRVASTCTSCAVGCRVSVESTTNRLTRKQGLDSEPVNQGWLCDRGRYDFGWANSEDRLTAPLVRRGDELVEASWGEALGAAAAELSDVITKHGPDAVGVIGGARLTNEDCYAWAKLAKSVLRTDNTDAQLGDGLPPEVVLGLPQATIADACSASTLVVIAPDLKEELPVLFLRLRGAVIDHGLRVIEVTPRPTALTPLAAVSLVHRPGEAAAVAGALVADDAPADAVGGVPAAALASARAALSAAGDGVVVVLGRPSLAESADLAAAAAGALHAALPGATFLPALRRGNVRGALDMGLAPGLLPGRVSLDAGREWFEQQWGALPTGRGLDAAGMLRAASEGRLHALVLLGADPLADFPDRELARRALTTVGRVIAVDTFLTDSSRHATVVLAAAGYGEKEGSTTNIEGRVTRLGQEVVSVGTSWADWVIATELAHRLGGELGFESVEDVWAEIERVAPAHAGLTLALLRAPGRADGIVVPVAGDPAAGARTLAEAVARDPGAAVPPASVVDGAGASVGVRIRGATIVPGAWRAGDAGVATAGAEAVAVALEDRPEGDGGEGDGRGEGDDGHDGEPAVAARPPLLAWSPAAAPAPAPPVDAYSLRLVSGRELYDPLAVSVAKTPVLAGLSRPAALRVNPFELERLGVPSGHNVHVTSSRGTFTLKVVGDDAVPRGTATLPFNAATPGAAELIDASAPVTDVRLERA